MARLIDANALRTDFLTRHGMDDFEFDNCYPFWQFSQAIANAPTVDAVALPCRMGDMVWGIRRNFNNGHIAKRGKVFQMFFGDDMRLCISVKNVCRGEWGKNVFATKEEAEAAIRERRTDNER